MDNIPIKHADGYQWKDLHAYYMNIKNQYRLTSYDIVRQLSADLNIPFYYSITQYLSESAHQRTPATKPGTCGRRVRDLLISGISPVVKANWLPSTSSYEEKLYDKKHDGYFYNYKFHVIKNVNWSVVPNDHPEIEVCIMNKQYMVQDENQPTKEQLVSMFTIDGIVPIVVAITQGYYL